MTRYRLSIRRLLQWRVRTMLLVILVLCSMLAWLTAERKKVRDLQELIALPEFEHQFFGIRGSPYNTVKLVHPKAPKIEYHSTHQRPQWLRYLLNDTTAGDIRELTMTRELTDTHEQVIGRLSQLCVASFTEFKDHQIVILARLPRLESIHLWADRLTEDGLCHLAELPKLRKLELYLQAPLSENAVVQLGRLAHLEELLLDGSGLTDQGLKQLAQLSRLKKLTLSQTQITDEGLDLLKDLGFLHELHIRDACLTEACVEQLVLLRSLKKLSLYDISLDIESGLRLGSSLRNLDTLQIDGPDIEQIARQLRLTHPHITTTRTTGEYRPVGPLEPSRGRYPPY